MNKRKTSILSLLILSVALATGFMFSTATGGQMKKSDCELACTKTYDECLRAPNANQTTCKAALNDCTASCKSKTPRPSPSPMVSPSPEMEPSPSPEMSPSPSPTPPTE